MKNSVLNIVLLVIFIFFYSDCVYSQKDWREDCIKFVNSIEEGECMYTKDDIAPLYRELLRSKFCDLDTISNFKDSIFILKSKHPEKPHKIILKTGKSTIVYGANAYLHIINYLSKGSVSECELSLLKVWFIDNLLKGPLDQLYTKNRRIEPGVRYKDLFPNYFYYFVK